MDPPEPISAELHRWFNDELRRAKLDAMKELAYGASHEINNPLANITLRAQTLLKQEEDPGKRRALEAMHRAAMRAHEMISDLMLFARPPQPEKSRVDLQAIAHEVVSELQARAIESEISLTQTPDDQAAPAEVDPAQIAVALRAVIENSLDALSAGGEIVVSVEPKNDTAEICVVDNGPGVPKGIEPHVFDPFFSGREAGRGLGFGLPKCWRIITQHGGDVRLRSKNEGGVVVTLQLPLALTTDG